MAKTVFRPQRIATETSRYESVLPGATLEISQHW
jgi:hypothetical protein